MQLPACLQQRYDLPLRPCGCGASGCIEQYYSGRGFAWLYEHITGRAIDGDDVSDAMQREDEDARVVFEAYIDGLATCLSQLLVCFDPDVIVIGGGVSKETEVLARLPATLPDVPYPEKKLPEILPARFGDSSGVRGAAMFGSRVG